MLGPAVQVETDGGAEGRRSPRTRAGFAKHKNDLQSCQRGSGQLYSCLLVAGWPLRRVKAASDSIWNSEMPAHRRELQACMAKRDFNLSSCLTLYYKWDSERALATADSVTRARLGR